MKCDVQRIPVGLLNSQSGPYGYLTSEAIKGGLLAIEEVNSADNWFELVPVIFDPKGIPELYQQACLSLIKEHKVQHIIGCYTSASRKQVLPVIERADALLWHPARYEGFEACENIIYVGAAPNQHVVQLAKYLIDTIGRDVFCVGTNYIWTWEMNRVLREILGAADGTVLGERVVDFATVDVTHLTDSIVKKRPSAVLSTLVGESSYAFLRAWDLAKRKHGIDIPIVSCSLSEPELKVIGPRASEGHIVCSTYFASLEREENRVFVQRYQARFGMDRIPFSDAESFYVSIMLLARAIARAETAAIDEVREALYLDRFDAPRGPVWIDPSNNHCFQTPRIAISRTGYAFEVFWEANEPLKPDPYLTRLSSGRIDGNNHKTIKAPNSYTHLRLVK